MVGEGVEETRETMTVLVFLVFSTLYVTTMFPSLAPYRDAGEMAVSAYTLGVAHPTGYPFYVLLGSISQFFPLANSAYRLALLSALAAAAATAVVYRWMATLHGRAAGVCAALLLGLNPTFWSVAQVQEMYSVWILSAASLVWLAAHVNGAYSEKKWLGFCFLYGLALTNRLDLLLYAPGLLWIALSRPETRSQTWAGFALLAVPGFMAATGSNWPIVLLIVGTALWLAPSSNRASWAAKSVGFALLGLSLYLYLPIRSFTRPWLDWNHPAELSNFLESLLRTRYGGTLDLLSKNYARGELFFDNMRLYGAHLLRAFTPAGLALVVAGASHAMRLRERSVLGYLAAYLWAGPLFLFMANLPPNPHAAAIVEPHYLLSDLILVLWGARGAAWAGERWRYLPAAAAALLLAWPLAEGRLGRFERRLHVFTEDFARAVFLSAEPGAVVVAKKDVQLYTLWNAQTVRGKRPDLRLVSQGLAGSPWYQDGWRRRPGAPALLPLRDAEGWARFVAANGRVYASPDCEVPPELAQRANAAGLLSAWNRPAGASAPSWELVTRRGDYDYDEQPDFFTSDLIDSFAQAKHREGAELARSGPYEKARAALLSAWSWRWLFPEPPVFLAYAAFTAGKTAEAAAFYEVAALLHRRLLALAEDYSALPAVRENIRLGAAQAYLHWGVTLEKLGRPEEAEARYRDSLAIKPLAQARYNTAVLYWTKDPPRARAELEEALRLDPNHPEARRYLGVLSGRRQ